jgi:DNA-directed RNA polymerase subunit alpha
MKSKLIDKIGLNDQIQTSEIIPSLERTEQDQSLIKAFKSFNSNSDSNQEIGSNDIELLKYKFRNASIEELELPVRAYNCLKRAQIHTIADLFKYSPEELLKLKNFGRVSAFKLYTALKDQFGIIWFGLI